MAEDKKPDAKPGQTGVDAAKAAVSNVNPDDAKKATAKAREESREVLEEQEEARPEPSQEVVDRIRERSVTAGEGGTYRTREAKK